MYELPDINQRLIILDTEVTGRNRKDFSILEVCAFEMINGKMTGLYFHSFFKPKHFMTPQKIKKHKVPKEAFSYTKEKEIDILLHMICFIENSIIIAHNADFDLEIVNKALENYDLPKISQSRFRCSMRLFLKYYPKFSAKLSSLNDCCKYLDIKFTKKRQHLASYDAFLAGQIIEKIYERTQTQTQNSIQPNNNFISSNDKSKENKNDNESFTIFKEHEDKDEVEGKTNSNVNNDNNINKVIGNISDIKEEKKKEIKDNELNFLIDNNIEDLKAEKEEQETFENFINENLEKIVLEMSKKDNNVNERDSIGEFINENLNVISFLLKNNNNSEYLGKKRK